MILNQLFYFLHPKSFDYYRKAADQNHPRALVKVGLLYYDGEIVEKNDKLVLECFTKAANLDNDDALFFPWNDL